jgi:hypothetical protein
VHIRALLLSPLQFAFAISLHIIVPPFTIGAAAWLRFLEELYQTTGRPTYRLIFELWLKVFALAFGIGVVTGVVTAFQFGIGAGSRAMNGQTTPDSDSRKVNRNTVPQGTRGVAQRRPP